MRVDELKGLGAKKAEILAERGIYTVSDLLRQFPASYEDRTKVTPVGSLVPGTMAMVRVEVLKILGGRRYGRKQVIRVQAADATGTLELVYFNGGFMARLFEVGKTYHCFGTVSVNNGRIQMIHPSFAKSDDESFLGIRPTYRVPRGISQKDMARYEEQILESRYFREVLALEYLPQEFLAKYGLPSLKDSLRKVHFPKTFDEIGEAERRFLYENMLLLQLGLQIMREHEERGIAFPRDRSAEEFLSMLSFELTGAQKRTLDEVIRDMEAPAPMNRLIQGDVGSGKTVVAQAALYKAAVNGYQGAYMMPTEILARQQYEELAKLFSDKGIRVGLLVGSMRPADKRAVQEALANGELQVVVGTHTLFQKGVEYANLGLVITDEQHRFGVRQRSAMVEKGLAPDCIVMSATPIPRTLAMILFGDMDISIIDEMPAGRLPILTKAVTEKKRDTVYRFVEQELMNGHQVYVVTPLIEESEAMEDVRSANEVYEELAKRFADYDVALLHGAMDAEDKAQIMEDFAAGKIQLLVATVVIEVGINVPNATVMVIENAERFGLSQMHQLRGRVGRGQAQSYCVLITADTGETAIARARTMVESSDGFYIAEKDLELRGPGELFGERQHGVPSTQLMGLMNHMEIYREVEGDATKILEKDPGLLSDRNELLRDAVEAVFGRDVRPTL